MTEDDVKGLVLGLRRRDPNVLDRLIEQYQYRLFRYLIYLTGNRDQAEDFFQETWIRVLERGHQYNDKWRFDTWLFTIARNLVVDWQRRKKPQSLDDLMAPDEGAPFEPSAPPEESPLQQAVQQQSDATVQALLERVPSALREVLVLRFQEELKLEEIASVTDTPISTVKTRLYRGLEVMRGLLQEGQA